MARASMAFWPQPRNEGLPITRAQDLAPGGTPALESQARP